MNTWNSLMEQQMSAFNSLVDTAVAQAKLYSESKDYTEMVSGQVELTRKLAEEMVEKSRKSAEVVQSAGEAYRSWAEESFKQVSDQANKAA
jgi:phasin family protein